MGMIKAGEGKVFDEFEQFVIDNCPGVSDQEATLAALRHFVGDEVSEALADRAKLVEGSQQTQKELNELRRILAVRDDTVKDLERRVAKGSELTTNLTRQIVQLGGRVSEPVLETLGPEDLPGGHGDPGEPPGVSDETPPTE